MKRYLLFAGDNYYPSGGWGDFVTSHDDIEVLRRHPDFAAGSNDGGLRWSHIVDTHTGQKYRPAWDAETLEPID